MTFPTYDPQTGLQLNAAGTDLAPSWPKDGAAWTAAVVKARLWLIKGQWKYDLREGIDLLGSVLGQVPDLRVIQELFRRQIARDVEVTRLRLREGEKGELILDWRGKSKGGEEQGGTISLIEPPAIEEVVFLRKQVQADTGGTFVSLRFSETLFPQVLPTAADFEFLRDSLPPPAIVSMSIESTQLHIIFADDIAGTEMLYLSSNNPMRGISQTPVSPFRTVFAGTPSTADALLLESGDNLLLESGDLILLEN